MTERLYGCFGKRADAPDSFRLALLLRMAGGGFWGLPLVMLEAASRISPTKPKRITALARGAIRLLGADLEHPPFFPSIRITLRPRCLMLSSSNSLRPCLTTPVN